MHVLWSSPRYLLRYHSLVHSKNNSYFVGIAPICDVELTCIFWPVFTFVHCIEDSYQYYKIIFLIHICFQMLLSWHWIMFCALFWCRIWKCTFCRYIYNFPVSTHSDEQHHHLTTLPLYRLHTADIERLSSIRSWIIVVSEIANLI